MCPRKMAFLRALFAEVVGQNKGGETISYNNQKTQIIIAKQTKNGFTGYIFLESRFNLPSRPARNF